MAQDITILPSPTQPRLVATFYREYIHIVVLGPTAANGRATGSGTQGRAGRARKTTSIWPGGQALLRPTGIGYSGARGVA